MGTGFPQIPGGGFNAYQPSSQPAGGSQFSKTGVPGLNGGPSYPPGSDMTKFMDGLNNEVSSVTKGPNGESVVDWAKNLAAHSKGQVNPQSAAANSPSGGQLLSLMLADLMQQAMLKLKGKGGNADNQGQPDAFGGKQGFCYQA